MSTSQAIRERIAAQPAGEPFTVLVKKSDRLLFVSFWFVRQSVSGLFLLPASTVGASFG